MITRLVFLAAFPLAAQGSDDLSAPFRTAEIVILGEIHDNPAHHINQARITSDLQPQALVFEMITDADARAITPEMRQNAVALEAALGWNDSGWPDFAMYYPIFTAAPEAVVFGAALDRDVVRDAVTDGAAAIFGDSASLFGLDQPLPEAELAARVTHQQEAHCNALPESILPGMVEAQRLRDAGLARATVAALEHARAVSDTPQVVVITGNGHAREDWGMPVLLRAYFSDAPVEIATLAQFEEDPGPDIPFRSFLVAEPAERPDPCDAFK